VLDHLRKTAEPARDDGRSARHGLDRGKPEKLGDRDRTPIARDVHGRHRKDPRAPVQRGKVGVGDRAEDLDTALCREPAKQVGIAAFGRGGVVAGGADDAKLSAFGHGLDQAVDALVRRQPSDEEDTPADDLRVGREAHGVGTPVDHPGQRRRRAEFARRIRRYREEAVEEPREKPQPGPSSEAVVGDRRRDPAYPRVDGGESARGAPEMVRVDDVGVRERMTEPDRDRMRGMPAEEQKRPKNADAKATRLPPHPLAPAEADELAVDTARERAPELERVPLPAPEDAVRAEERRRDVDDPHLVLPLVTLGDPGRLSGGYLYHQRMAEAAPAYGARIVFLSFPEWPFPLAALRSQTVLRRARDLRPSAVLLDSIASAFAWPALAASRPGVPVVGVLHQPPGGIDHRAARAWVQALLDRLAWRRANLLIAASEHLAAQLVDAGLAESRIRVVPPGRDIAPVPSGSAPDLRGGREAAFLTIANWLPRKGILELLAAFARLPAHAATLHLVGDESADTRYAAQVRSRLTDRQLAGRVVVHGRLAREEVAALYGAADVFVLPAYREPYGTVWGEAMSFGLPVVGWRAGNLPYLAENEREGLLVSPGDVGALSGALLRLASDGALRTRMGAAAKRRALTRPTWHESASLFFAAIREVAGARGDTTSRRGS
jgi:glycosyltransferase involved in cell wall biosynthesis